MNNLNPLYESLAIDRSRLRSIDVGKISHKLARRLEKRKNALRTMDQKEVGDIARDMKKYGKEYAREFRLNGLVSADKTGALARGKAGKMKNLEYEESLKKGHVV